MTTSDPVEFRRSLTVLHMALCMGCALFLGVTAYLWSDGAVPMMKGEAMPALSILGMVSAAVIPVLAMVLFRQKIRSLPVGAPFAEQASAVRAATIMHWALIEGALFFNVVVFMLQADTLHWGIGVALLMLLVLRAPSERRMQGWLNGTA